MNEQNLTEAMYIAQQHAQMVDNIIDTIFILGVAAILTWYLKD